MINTRKIIQIARKYQRRRTQENVLKSEGCSLWIKGEKGHFVVYSTDKRRFVLPLAYLNNNIFRELFKWAEEEFGLSSNVPLMLPCDGTVIEYIITLIQGNVAKDMEEAVLMSIATPLCQSYLVLHHERTSKYLLYNFVVDGTLW